jgi:hypothetical protein
MCKELSSAHSSYEVLWLWIISEELGGLCFIPIHMLLVRSPCPEFASSSSSVSYVHMSLSESPLSWIIGHSAVALLLRLCEAVKSELTGLKYAVAGSKPSQSLLPVDPPMPMPRSPPLPCPSRAPSPPTTGPHIPVGTGSV